MAGFYPRMVHQIDAGVRLSRVTAPGADVTDVLRSMKAAPIESENPPLTHEIEDQA